MQTAGTSRFLSANAHRRVTRGGPASLAGMTLVELLIVMGLAALVLGFGVGALTSIDVSGRSAVGLVQSSLRSARSWAVAQDAPASVTLNLAEGTLSSRGLAVVGTWHFEQNPPKGAFDLNGELVGGEIVEDGFLGSALSFVGAPPEAGYEVAVHKDPAFDLSDGFVIQCALRPETTAGGQILKLGRAVSIGAENDGALKIEFAALRVADNGERKEAGKAILRTQAGVLPPNRWSRLMVSYDRRLLRAFVEGVPVGELEESAYVAPLAEAMVVGGGRRAWQGAIDSLVVSAVAGSEVVQLPDSAKFASGSPEQIVFWPGGGLDRVVHSEPVELTIEFDDGVQVPIRVGLYGNVE
ncbi:MAG: hypothetical protein KDC14_14485 [Planctomycetes bacterium]|nr:hypothetical protein [Planctomycetota bacterium]